MEITNASLQSEREKVVAKGKISGTGCYVKRAEGSLITDVEGNEYIDFTGGIAVMNVGHSHPKVVDAMNRPCHQDTPLVQKRWKGCWQTIIKFGAGTARTCPLFKNSQDRDFRVNDGVSEKETFIGC